jgi:hypothetical protein
MGEMVGRWLGDGMEMGELMGSDAVRQDAHAPCHHHSACSRTCTRRAPLLGLGLGLSWGWGWVGVRVCVCVCVCVCVWTGVGVRLSLRLDAYLVAGGRVGEDVVAHRVRHLAVELDLPKGVGGRMGGVGVWGGGGGGGRRMCGEYWKGRASQSPNPNPNPQSQPQPEP